MNVEGNGDETRAARAEIFNLLAAHEGGQEVYGAEVSRVIADILDLPTVEERARELILLVSGAVEITSAFASYVAEMQGLERRDVADAVENAVTAVIERLASRNDAEQPND